MNCPHCHIGPTRIYSPDSSTFEYRLFERCPWCSWCRFLGWFRG